MVMGGSIVTYPEKYNYTVIFMLNRERSAAFRCQSRSAKSPVSRRRCERFVSSKLIFKFQVVTANGRIRCRRWNQTGRHYCSGTSFVKPRPDLFKMAIFFAQFQPLISSNISQNVLCVEMYLCCQQIQLYHFK